MHEITFKNLIAQLQNPNSAETQHAMRTLNTTNPNDIVNLINMRMQQQPPFFNSIGLFADFQNIEGSFAATVRGLNPDLWVNFVTQIRAFVQQPQPQQPQPQQPQQQYQQQQPQMQQQQPQQQQQQQMQQQQPQQQQPQQPQRQQQYAAEPAVHENMNGFWHVWNNATAAGENTGRPVNGGGYKKHKKSMHKIHRKKTMRKMRRKSMCKKINSKKN